MGVVSKELWAKVKETMYRRMLSDLEIGYLDPDIYRVLLALFRRPESFPVSSCSGRITVVDSQLPWHRRGSAVIFKKHSIVSESEISSVINQGEPLRRLWLVATGPILHVSSASMKEALTILRIARDAGMKHSGILSVSRRGIYTELKTGVRLTILLKAGDYVIENLGEAIRAANEALLEGKSRLERFYRLLMAAEQGSGRGVEAGKTFAST